MSSFSLTNVTNKHVFLTVLCLSLCESSQKKCLFCYLYWKKILVSKMLTMNLHRHSLRSSGIFNSFFTPNASFQIEEICEKKHYYPLNRHHKKKHIRVHNNMFWIYTSFGHHYNVVSVSVKHKKNCTITHEQD